MYYEFEYAYEVENENGDIVQVDETGHMYWEDEWDAATEDWAIMFDYEEKVL